jgi:hypothetical protein
MVKALLKYTIVKRDNVGNVILYVIYQLNFTVIYVCYTHITLYIVFGIIRGFA